MNRIRCPYCNKFFEISQALKHEIEEEISKRKDKEFQEKFSKIQAEVEKKTKKEFEEKNKIELAKANREKEELVEKLNKEKKEREEFEKKIVEKAQKEAEENQSLKLKEKDLKLEEIKKVNEELKRKLEQGSQQSQGEVLELDLEEKLKSSFPNDEFIPVPKGVQGADIWQKIIYKGKVMGSILWETKRTKGWSNSWISKLKDDAAKVSASESIIVSQTLPEGVKNFDRKEGVWITSYEHTIGICRYVRFLITTIASVKSSTSQTDEEWGKIRDYMISDTFKHRMQAHFDGIKELKDGFDAEKRATTLRWKRQEAQLEKLDLNTVNFYGELRERVSNLPKIQGVDLPQLGEDNNEENSETLI